MEDFGRVRFIKLHIQSCGIAREFGHMRALSYAPSLASETLLYFACMNLINVILRPRPVEPLVSILARECARKNCGFQRVSGFNPGLHILQRRIPKDLVSDTPLSLRSFHRHRRHRSRPNIQLITLYRNLMKTSHDSSISFDRIIVTKWKSPSI